MIEHSHNQNAHAHHDERHPWHAIAVGIAAAGLAAGLVAPIVIPSSATAVEPRVEEARRPAPRPSDEEDEPNVAPSPFDLNMRLRSLGMIGPDVDPIDPSLRLHSLDVLLVHTDLGASWAGIQQWKAGLANPETGTEHRKLLDDLVRAAADETGVVAFDTNSTLFIDFFAVFTMTPDEARVLVGSGGSSDRFQSLVSFARSHTATVEPESVPVKLVELLDWFTETQLKLAEKLEESRQTDPESGWSELLNKLSPAGLALGLLEAVLESANNGIISLGKKLYRRISTAAVKEMPGTKPAVDGESGELVARREAESKVGRLLQEGTKPDAARIASIPENLASLARRLNHDPETLAVIIQAVTEGVTAALSMQRDIREPARLAAAITSDVEDLVSRAA